MSHGQAMTSLVWLALVHALWLGLAAPALAALVLRARPGLLISTRHTILFGAFLLATLGPFVAAAGHREAARRSRTLVGGSTSSSFATETRPALQPSQLRAQEPSRPIRPDAETDVVLLVRAARRSLLFCWILGLIGTSGMVLIGLCSSLRLIRQSRPAPGWVEREARRLGLALNLRRCPPVLVHDTLAEPCLSGLIRPAIVMPAASLSELRPGIVSAVLAHELAHASRRDPLSNLAQWFLESLVLFHPGARSLSRSLRLHREHRADSVAVRLTGDPRSLAEALERFARIRPVPRIPGPLGSALGGESSLLPRIQEILGMKSKTDRKILWPLVSLPLAVLLAVVATTSGLALEDPPAKAADAAGQQVAPVPDRGMQAGDPYISYDVAVVEVDMAYVGMSPDFVVGETGEKLYLAFASDLERTILVKQTMQPPKGRMLQVPKVTTSPGATASFRLPRATSPALSDKKPPATSLKLTGELNAQYVQLTIRLTDPPREAAARILNEPTIHETKCTLPSGSTLLLSTDDPARRGHARWILVTPRRHPDVKPVAVF